ncbi:hypothetical protein E2C01_095052 [Portunus trituberculatus]|uniref:Uncharacterized protein n=1 Tax=Portunus trituberculatus TaxID=210409 RepID=A0A5B7JYI5_PORTR|nr:hypothetical protein [Portunus trituberculatus]
MHSSKLDVTSYPALPLPAAPRSDSTWRKTLPDRSLALISPRPANEMQIVMKSLGNRASPRDISSRASNPASRDHV